jgi:hypothetical protein
MSECEECGYGMDPENIKAHSCIKELKFSIINFSMIFNKEMSKLFSYLQNALEDFEKLKKEVVFLDSDNKNKDYKI